MACGLPCQIDNRYTGCEIKHQILEHVWLKVDTGMHRLGFDPHEVGEINTVLTAMGIQHITLMSHLAEAEGQ
jgi:alanine racemase